MFTTTAHIPTVLHGICSVVLKGLYQRRIPRWPFEGHGTTKVEQRVFPIIKSQ